MNFLDGTDPAADRSGVLVEIPGVPPLAVPADGAGCSVGDRSRSVSGRSTSRVDGEQADAADARVGATEQLGSDSYLYCELPQGQKLTIHHPGQTRIQRQDVVRVEFDPAACHLFRSGEGEPALPRLPLMPLAASI